MRKLILGLAALLGLAAGVYAQPGVNTDEILRRGNLVELINEPDEITQIFGVPQDDNHKWFITVIGTKGCRYCETLKRDLTTNSYLTSLVNVSDHKNSWAHYNYYLAEDKSQEFRWEKLRIQGFPTILVQPPLNKQYGDPSTIVMQQSGYNGNAKDLAKAIVDSIKKYVEALRNKLPPQTVNSIEKDPPWCPPPKDDPVQPVVNPSPLPLPLPLIFPNDVPEPKPVVDEPKSEYPELIVINDSEDGIESINNDKLYEILEVLKEQQNKNVKVKFMDWKDAKDKYPISRSEIPVILVTENGKIQDKISKKLLSLMATEKEVLQAPEEVPSSTIFGLLFGGASIPSLWVLGSYLLKWRRKNKEKKILNDEMFNKLIDYLELQEKKDV